jgi:hypothetical protein
MHIPNDPALFSSQEHARPRPVLTPDRLCKHEIEQILDSRPHGFQFLMGWKGYGPKDDKWLAV